MRTFFLITFFVVLVSSVKAQTINQYTISFDNAVHHEAEITATFTNLSEGPFEVRMSRTSPGRYAIHDFAKNVYDVHAYDSKGNELDVSRPNPQQWDVTGHDGTVVFTYTLFANRGGGTYSQVDETHAHLNIPATFVYARNYQHRPVEITFNVREDLNWRVATQLEQIGTHTYAAPDLYYFMDSPVEIADFHLREEMIDGQLIRLALHTPASDTEINEYFDKVIAIVEAEKAVFGELPNFDFGEYTFLSCYMPNASGDGMEHRNSTVVSSSKPLDRPLGETSISTIAHEFFHAWNVERIRPGSLEPFDFEDANMSGELWFAEGFTSYYTGLILARAGIRTEDEYIERLDGALNYVINSPGRDFFNPIEMSYRAPFVDAATSIDPTNNNNIFISYYSYGSVLGLGLDLSLREHKKGLSLDGFMQLMWKKYGKTEIPYNVQDIEAALGEYAGNDFATTFFGSFIYKSEMPDYSSLLSEMGVTLKVKDDNKVDPGARIREKDGRWMITANTTMGGSFYNAGLDNGDEILSIGGIKLAEVDDVEEILSRYRPGQTAEVTFIRYDEERTVEVTFKASMVLESTINERAGRQKRAKREAWIKGK
ncbi:MAG TPA: peptidase M61 [Balneolaceae bacterium]|nr:peptidase M61 [Balneolaceae bacterium]|tara:strand:- start:51315 stop:53108 length:1794 start_codon:yes stop_codon:yes gene_type:complete